MTIISKILSPIKSAPASLFWHIRDPQNYTLLYYFLKSGQDVRIAPTQISEQTQRLIAKSMHEENLRLGSPVKLDKAIEEMTFYDWLEVHHSLLKFKVLHAGKRRTNYAKLFPGYTQKTAPRCIYKFIDSRATQIAVLSGFAMFIALTVGISFLEVHSVVNFTVSFMSSLAFFNVSGSAMHDLLIKKVNRQLEYNISTTWEEVLTCNKPEDVILLDMVYPLLQANIALRDMSPAEALDLCFRKSDFAYERLYQQWCPADKSTATSIPVPHAENAAQAELLELTSSFRSKEEISHSH